MHNLQFDYQSPGMCGHQSLIHALMLLGITITEDEAIRLTGVSRSEAKLTGTDEKKLKTAIRKAGCKLHAVTCRSEKKARSKVDKFLEHGMPVIINADNEEHWAVIAGNHRDRYFWIDSGDLRLLGNWPWKRIADWMEYDNHKYYLIGIEAPDMSFSVVERFYSIYPILKLRQYSAILRFLFYGIRR